jgi:hypothetical protein
MWLFFDVKDRGGEKFLLPEKIQILKTFFDLVLSVGGWVCEALSRPLHVFCIHPEVTTSNVVVIRVLLQTFADR